MKIPRAEIGTYVKNVTAREKAAIADNSKKIVDIQADSETRIEKKAKSINSVNETLGNNARKVAASVDRLTEDKMSSIKSAGDRIAKSSKETEAKASDNVSRIVDAGRKSVEDVESKAT